MKTKIVRCDTPEHAWSVKVSEATTRMGIRKTFLQIEAEKYRDEEMEVHFLRQHTYPDLVSCVEEAEGFSVWPVSFDEFLALPDRFAVEWEKTVYELNPHWLPGQSVEEQEKKA